MHIFLVIVIFLSVVPFYAQAKAGCEKHLNKVYKIQEKQREGHSAKQSNVLNKKEHNARKKWWECTKSAKKKIAKKKKKSKKKSKRKTKKKSSKKKKSSRYKGKVK
jgi:hypothetical protein